MMKRILILSLIFLMILIVSGCCDMNYKNTGVCDPGCYWIYDCDDNLMGCSESAPSSTTLCRGISSTTIPDTSTTTTILSPTTTTICEKRCSNGKCIIKEACCDDEFSCYYGPGGGEYNFCYKLPGCCPEYKLCPDNKCVGKAGCCSGERKCEDDNSCIPSDQCCDDERKCDFGCVSKDSACCPGQEMCNGECITAAELCPDKKTCPDGTEVGINECCPYEHKCGLTCQPAGTCCSFEKKCGESCAPQSECCPGEVRVEGACVPEGTCPSWMRRCSDGKCIIVGEECCWGDGEHSCPDKTCAKSGESC